MTAAGATPAARRPPRWTRHGLMFAPFIAIGWTTDQWDDLYEFLTANHRRRLGYPTATEVLYAWMRNPPAFHVPLSAATVRDMFTRHDLRAVPVLNVLAAGGTERFTLAFLNQPTRTTADAGDGWRFARFLGLTEDVATGWAATGYLHPQQYQPPTRKLSSAERATLIRQWTARFGPDAWRYVLADITLEEAIALQDAGQLPDGELLRVMAVLNGRTLPVET